MIYLIGVDEKGEQVVGSKETREQIDRAKKLECALVHKSGKPLTWEAFDDPEEPRTLFQAILRDRKRRVDEGALMVDRPLFAVVTAHQGMAVRLEYYEGHDALGLVFDIRCKELQGKDMPRYLEEDPQAYDPVAFLEKAFGIPKEFSEPLLKELHKREKEEE
jgi:hypothetical protein